MKLTIQADFIPDLDERHSELIRLTIEAHDKAARNNPNASSAACINAVGGSGRITNGIASAIMTLGPIHGPISDARFVYEEFTPEHVSQFLGAGRKIPGFGNSFFRDGIDPAWVDVDQYIRGNFKLVSTRIDGLRKMLTEHGKDLHPNAAMYTAAVCSVCGVKRGAEAALFIMARIPAWVHLSLSDG